MTEQRNDPLIREIDPYDDEEMRTYQRLYVEAERAELPDAHVYPLEDIVTMLTRPSIGSAYTAVAAFERGRMVGEGFVMANTVDSLDSARLWAWVPPAERGRGVGSALVEHMVRYCAGMGRGILQSSATYAASRRDDHPYRRFAERHGFALANTEIERRLALPVPADRLDELAREAGEHASSYLIETIVGRIPSERVQGYLDVLNRLRTDAPAGDLVVEAARRTPEVLADQEEEIVHQGRTRVTALALDGAGTVVGFSCAAVTPAGLPQVNQWGTLVRPDHRGHRLGLAVKVALVRTIQDAFPDKRFVTTTNAETNAHMVAINEALGFRLYALEADFQRILPGYGPDR